MELELTPKSDCGHGHISRPGDTFCDYPVITVATVPHNLLFFLLFQSFFVAHSLWLSLTGF